MKRRLILPTLCILAACHLFGAGPHFEVTGATIAATQSAIRTGQTTCRAIVQSYLKRIEAYDQQPIQGLRLNAIVTLNPNALAEADACDRSFAATHKLPLLGGVAVLIKDNYDTVGIQTTGGSLALKGFVPTRDAPMVARLRAAGAIVLAKTNMAEWAFSPYVTVSSIAGITRNPYDLERVPAGSSGGTAAGVAASLGESGLGTDTGNSIRGPSSHNALVGIRPTIGLISTEGIIPLFAHNDVGGPMARTVADAATLLTALANPEHAQDFTRSLDRSGLRGARIGVFRRYIDTPTTDPEVKARTEEALKAMRQAGAEIIDPFDLSGYDALTKNLWCGDFESDLNAYLAQHPNAPYHDLKSIVDSGLYLPYIQEEIRGAIARPAAGDRRTPCSDVYHDPPKIAFRDSLLAAMQAQHLDAVVYPTWSNAPRKVGDMAGPAGDNSQVLSPQTGFPAITVPMGYTHDALPAGLTFLGASFSEAKLIRYVYAFEQATAHRKEPPLFPALNLRY